MPVTEYPFTHGGVTRDVLLIDGPGPPVVLLHEISGVSRTCRAYGEMLAEDFRVHIPILHGYPGQSVDHFPGEPYDPLRKLRVICVRREMAVLGAGRQSPIATWMRALCRHAAGGRAGSVGVIGMCLTGGLVIPLALDPAVGAAVASQPSLPFRGRATGLGPGDLGDSVEHVAQVARSGTPVLGLRYENDPMCPASRFDAAAAAFDEEGGDFGRFTPEPPTVDIPGDLHSVLTDQPYPGARERVREFLVQHLGSA